MARTSSGNGRWERMKGTACEDGCRVFIMAPHHVPLPAQRVCSSRWKWWWRRKNEKRNLFCSIHKMRISYSPSEWTLKQSSTEAWWKSAPAGKCVQENHPWVSNGSNSYYEFMINLSSKLKWRDRKEIFSRWWRRLEFFQTWRDFIWRVCLLVACIIRVIWLKTLLIYHLFF